MILTRTDERRKRAQARGVRFGRKPKLSAFQIAEAIARRAAGDDRYRQSLRRQSLNDIEAGAGLGVSARRSQDKRRPGEPDLGRA